MSKKSDELTELTTALQTSSASANKDLQKIADKLEEIKKGK